MCIQGLGLAVLVLASEKKGKGVLFAPGFLDLPGWWFRSYSILSYPILSYVGPMWVGIYNIGEIEQAPIVAPRMKTWFLLQAFNLTAPKTLQTPMCQRKLTFCRINEITFLPGAQFSPPTLLSQAPTSNRPVIG